MKLPEIKYDFQSSPRVAIRKWESLFMKDECFPRNVFLSDCESFYLKSISDDALKVDEALTRLKQLLWNNSLVVSEKEIYQELNIVCQWQTSNTFHLCAKFSIYYRFFDENSRLAWFASLGHPDLDYRHIPDQCKMKFLMLLKKLKAIVLEEQLKNQLILEFVQHEPMLYPNEFNQLTHLYELK